MKRRLVTVSGVLWTCAILSLLAGVPASRFTASQQRSTGVSTAASPGNSGPRPAVITRGNGQQEDAGETGSTASMARGHRAGNTLTSAARGPSESSPRQARGTEDVCHVTAYPRAWKEIYATGNREMVLYFLPGRSFRGIKVYLYLAFVDRDWWISKEELCIISTTEWHELSVSVFADSENEYRWSLRTETEECPARRRDTSFPRWRYPFSRLTVSSYGSSCWRLLPAEAAGPSNRTRDTTAVSSAVELTTPADEVLTTSPPPADGPRSQVDQVAIVVATVVVLVALVVAGVFIRRRMTSHARTAPPDEDICSGGDSGIMRSNTKSVPATPDSTQAPTAMVPGYRLDVEPQSSQPSSANGHIHEELDVLRGFPESDMILVREAFASRLFQ